MSSKKIYGFYHIFLTEDTGTWAAMFLDQMKLVEDSGLLDAVDNIFITVIGSKDSFEIFTHLAATYGQKFQLVNFYEKENKSDSDSFSNRDNNTQKFSENVAMTAMKTLAENEDFHTFYFHTKGITSVENHLKKGDVYTYKNYLYWRKFCEWGIIEKWKDCLTRLSEFDVVGVNYFDHPAPHYSGGFWWANSSYINTLPDINSMDWWYDIKNRSNDPWLRSAPDRFKDEMWICSNTEGKFNSIKDSTGLIDTANLSQRAFLRKNYEV